MTIDELNKLTADKAKAALAKCCGSSRWASQMTAQRPFENELQLLAAARDIWVACTRFDWLEAFTHHPRIGDVSDLQKKFSTTKEWADQEQKGVRSATSQILQQLTRLNKEYESKFGYIFIVRATGKSAEEMLAMVQQRLQNSTKDEIKIAMAEQGKITTIRIKKLLS